MIEVDSLHPSLLSHVILVSAPGDRLEKREKDTRLTRNENNPDEDQGKEKEKEKPLTKAQIDKMHAEALAIDSALYPKD